MTDSIPTLVSKLRQLPDDVLDWDSVRDAITVLESLSAPSGDDEREALEAGYQSVRDSGVLTNDVHRNALIWRAVDPAIRAALAVRRPSPVTREALIEALKGTDLAGYVEGDLGILADAAASIMSALSLPEPAEVEWEYRRLDWNGKPILNATFETPPVIDPGYSIERRSLGEWEPWVPVKGTERL